MVTMGSPDDWGRESSVLSPADLSLDKMSDFLSFSSASFAYM